jgi:hypothetical protein
MKRFPKAIVPASIVVVVLMLGACGQIPFARLAGGQAIAEVGWDTQNSANRSAEPSIQATQGAISTAAEVQAWYDSFYDGLGTRRFSVTPTEFSFTSPLVLLSNSNTYYDFGFSNEQTDFADSTSARRQVSVNRTFYDSLFLQFVPRGQELSDGAGSPRSYRPAVVVTLPGYTDSELPDLGPSIGVYSGAEFYERRYLGNNQFQFTYGELQPDLSPFYANPPGFEVFAEYIIVTTSVDAFALVVPDGDTHGTYDYTSNNDYGAVTDRPFVLVPWDGVYVDPMSEKAALTVTLDIQDIVHVYDNGTPIDMTDDHVVLANRFWERFGIDVE